MNYSRLCNIVFRIIGDRNLAEDIVQEVFVKLWNKRHDIRLQESNVVPYLKRMVVNKSLDYLKTVKRQPSNRQIDLILLIENYTADSHINFQELKNIVNEAVDNLPPKCKTIFVLCRFEGMNYKAIATQLDISVKTVENQMNIALKKLHGALEPDLKHHYISTISWLLLFSEFII